MSLVWQSVTRFAKLWRVAIGVLLAASIFFLWETSQALRDARDHADSQSSIALTVRPLGPLSTAEVEPIGTPASFRDAALFNGHLFIAGPHGLLEYDTSGALIRRFRPGIDLPAADIVSLVTGVLAASAAPELVIATSGEGLLIYDGSRFRHVRPERAEHRKLTATLWLGGGRVLLGTDAAGLYVYDGRRLTLAHAQLAGVHVTALAGSDGDVWVGTLDRGVLHWRAAEVAQFDEHRGLPDARVLSVVARDDRAYVGTALGVAEFRGNTLTRTLGQGLFASALALRDDTLLVGTLDETIARLPLETRPSRGVRPLVEEAPGPIHRFLDTGGELYALTSEAIYVMDQGGARLREAITMKAERLTDGNISALAVDRTGRLWVGYFDRGLDIVAADGQRAAHVEDDRVFCVNRIVHDAAGTMTAVATANGLVLFDSAGRQKELLGRAQGLIADHVTDLVLDAGGMTIATPAGLTFIDPSGSRSLYAFHGLVNNHVYALGATGTTLLAGTLGGVSVLQNGAVQASYTTANSALTHNWITAIARVDEGWFVGTYGGGLFHLDGRGTWKAFPDLDGRIEVNPNALLATSTHVFAGTLSNGLLVYDRQARRWARFASGLPSMNVTALATAPGALYVGTDNGIVRIREQAFAHP